MNDAEVLFAARSLRAIYARAGDDKQMILKALIALGTYAQRCCGESTWHIRMEAVMLGDVQKES